MFYCDLFIKNLMAPLAVSAFTLIIIVINLVLKRSHVHVNCISQSIYELPFSAVHFFFSICVISLLAKDKGSSTPTQHIIFIHS